MKFEDFIYEQPKQLTPQFCKNLIEKYETNDEAIRARAQGHLGVGVWNIQSAKSFKQSEDVNISHLSEFIQEDKIFVIENGFDFEKQLTPTQSIKNVESKYNLNRNKFYVAFVMALCKSSPRNRDGLYDVYDGEV